MSEWQPIETAPRDGTRVLLYRANTTGTKPLQIGKWGSVKSMGVVCSPEWLSDCNQMQEAKPTHWMPLPDPPSGDT